MQELVTELEQEEFYKLIGEHCGDRKALFFKIAASAKTAGYDTLYLARRLPRISYQGICTNLHVDWLVVGLLTRRFVAAVSPDTFDIYKVGQVYSIKIV